MTATPGRRGSTLVELTVALVLLTLVVGGLLAVMDRQQRFYRETSAVAASRSQVRQAAAILPGELRALAPAGGDLAVALDSALEFRSTIASGVVCARGADWIALVPLRPPGEPALAAELFRPGPGDLAHILVPDDSTPSADRWPAVTIAAVADEAAACEAGPFITPADAGRPRRTLMFAVALPPGVREGAPVRITRPVRYSLYRSGDRLWYLGVNDRTGGRWSGVQPVSGPFAAPGPAGGGIHFVYRDEAGAEVAPGDAGRVARITLEVRGATPGAGGADSAEVDVALRNREP